MSKYLVDVRHCITYNHTITVDCDDEEKLDAAIVALEKHAYDDLYGGVEDIASELETVEGIKILEVTKDESGDGEFEYDYYEG